jgi:Flp pilus assembly protein TadD
MRFLLLGLTLLLAACGGDGAPLIGDGAPGVGVADAALAAGLPNIALNVANGVLAKEPHDIEALRSQADALAALEQRDEAAAAYSKLLAAQPHSVPALIGLGRLRLRPDPASAQILFQTALQRDPRSTIALNDLGIALDLQGAHEPAQEAYRKALGLDPRSSAAQVNLALSMTLSGRAAEAVGILRPVAARPDASPRVRENLAAAMLLAGDPQGAARLLGRDLPPDQVETALQGLQALAP